MKLYLIISFYLFYILGIGSALAESPQLKIVQIKINDVDYFMPYNYGWGSISYTKKNEDGTLKDLELTVALLSTFEVKFNYIGQSKPQFRYQLKGYENNWHWIESGQIVKYKDIRHGRYTLVIQAIKNSSIINETKLQFYNNISNFWIDTDFINLIIIILCIYGIIKIK